MVITEITIGITDSVKLAPYEYAKPEVRLTAQVEDGESAEKVKASLTERVKDELAKLSAQLKADYQ